MIFDIFDKCYCYSLHSYLVTVTVHRGYLYNPKLLFLLYGMAFLQIPIIIITIFKHPK